jgi:hypothetical protein
MAGCGGGSEGQTEMPPQLNMLASQMANVARDETRFQESFASGTAAPENREKYTEYQYRVMKTEVDGNTATLEVSVRNLEGTELGVEQWTANQEGETWKLSAAPLPAGAQ